MKNNKKNEILQRSNNGLYFFKLILGGILQHESNKRFKNVKNPFYNDKNASLSIYQNDKGIWCFKDYGNIDFSGDVFDFCALYYKLDIKKDFFNVLNFMENDLDKNQTSVITINEVNFQSSVDNKNEVIDVELSEISFSNASKNYMLQYGITPEILKINNVAEITAYKEIHLDNRFDKFKGFQNQTFYAYKQDKFAKLYRPNPKTFLYVGKKPKDYVFGLNFKNESNLIYLVGGEKDVLTFHSIGIQAICLNSETSLPSKRLIKSFYEDKISPIIMYDCDETGRKSAEKISNLTGWKVADLGKIIPIENRNSIKDISDYVYNKLSIQTLKDFLNSFSKENEEIEDLEFSEEIDAKEIDISTDNYSAISSKVYDNLPELLKNIVSPMNEKHKKDLVLTGSLAVLSNFINVSGTYGRMTVYPNLYLFITAPASAGKGSLRWVRKLGESLRKRYADNYKMQLAEYNDNGKKGEKPKRKSVFVSANASVAALLKQLYINDGRGIMLETEADSLNEVLKNQWGNLSDVLRKCFEFEFLSSLRADDDKTFEIQIPRLSIVLTGTKNQLFDLIPSAQNGLFSRFLFIEFPLVKKWEDMFESDNSLDDYYDNLSKKVLKFFDKTSNIDIQFKFTLIQSKRFNQYYEQKQNEFDLLLGEDSIASIRRIGNMQFRIAMLLSTIRMLEKDVQQKDVQCEEIDFEIAEILADWFMNHTKKIFTQLPNKPKEYKELKTIDAQLFEMLPDIFGFQDALMTAESLGIPKGTLENMLRRFRKYKILEVFMHNQYRKIKQ